MMSSPPPCPLCRAPLDSLVLTYDMATIISPMMVDANVDANTRAWVRDYNLRRGLIAPPRTSLVWTFLAHHACVIAYVITLALILGLVAVRIKVGSSPSHASLYPSPYTLLRGLVTASSIEFIDTTMDRMDRHRIRRGHFAGRRVDDLRLA
ncbi:uncharacterized protein LOC105702312 isoform X2 [Orussus abietinus]|uniref:uncharacterized protein LOC105702312 isoform X2 n=1 Tax=Orussus abietinus TaxID=222816 RepID=UPI000625EE0A|nr:uncharacterized protein LOC105702312 isoform X2 [Orussus abietinus]